MMKQTRAIKVRADEEPLIVEGIAVVFDSPANIGGITEYISRAAFDDVDLENIVLLVNHNDFSIPLARSPKTLTLTITDKGLEMRAELPNTEQGRSVYEAVKRGDLSEMSFAFNIGEQSFDKQKKERIITKIAAIYEISIVNRAAYPQTNIQARAGKENINMNNFNPIESAILNKAQNDIDTHSLPEYRSAFYKHLLGKELTEYETRAFNAARAEKRADSFNTLSNNAAVVPTQTLKEVIRQARGINGLFNEVRLFSVPSNLSVPIGTPADPASWHTEGAPIDRNSVLSTSVTFTGRELIKILSMSAAAKRMEIAAFESYITQELRSAIADAIGAAIVNGNGVGQPTGILTGISWTKNKNAIGTSTITADNLLTAISKIPAGYSGGAKFAMSSATLFGQIYTIKDNDGRYIFSDPQTGGVYRIFGFEIVIDDNIPTGTVIFGNFNYYGINIPESIAVEVSRESSFTSGLIDFRALCIADGKPIVPEAFIKVEIAA